MGTRAFQIGAVMALLTFCCLPCAAGRPLMLYLEPRLGFAHVYLSAIEIDNSFVSTISNESVWDDLTNVDINGVVAPVGRVVRHEGNGMSAGGSAGIRISGLRLGVSFSWVGAQMSGYSKRYLYTPELLRASGRRYYDTGDVDFFRLQGEFGYGLSLKMIVLEFMTRVGSMHTGPSALILGRATETASAITGEIGVSLKLRPSRWISVGVAGYGGFFAFLGTYEGSFGWIAGVDGTICLYF